MFGSQRYKSIALLLASTLVAATPVLAQDNKNDNAVFTVAQQEEIAACFAQHKGTLYAYAGLNLTPEQIANYNVILENVGQRIGKINENTPFKKLTYGGLAASIREGTSEADSMLVPKAIDAVQHLPTAEQIRLLTASHGKYAVFDYGSYADYSDAQIKASNVLGQEYEDRMAAMMTPAQQTKFRSNLASVKRYMACERSSPASTYSIQWFMGNFGDEGPKF
jgi:Spy/CpxP family protein refolding chaperone